VCTNLHTNARNGQNTKKGATEKKNKRQNNARQRHDERTGHTTEGMVDEKGKGKAYKVQTNGDYGVTKIKRSEHRNSNKIRQLAGAACA
jgi:hypothetical protein